MLNALLRVLEIAGVWLLVGLGYAVVYALVRGRQRDRERERLQADPEVLARDIAAYRRRAEQRRGHGVSYGVALARTSRGTGNQSTSENPAHHVEGQCLNSRKRSTPGRSSR